MKKSEKRDPRPELDCAGPRLGENGAFFDQAACRAGEPMERTRAYRDPDDLFGIWTHCEKKTVLRSLSRHSELESEVRV